MTSFGVLVTVVGVAVGTVSILITGFILYNDRRVRNAKLSRVDEDNPPRPGLEKDDRGNIKLRQLDEAIGSFTARDYATNPKVAELVDTYLRPFGDLSRLRNLLEKDLLEKESEEGQEQGTENEEGQKQQTNRQPRFSLRNADLSGADLRNINLGDVDLTGTNLRNTDLSGVRGLEPGQIEKAVGDAHTKLPEYLERERPRSWTQDKDEREDEDA